MGLDLESTFYCTCCGKRGIPIARKRGQGREAGHLKKLYCLNCKREVNHVECKEFTHYTEEDFLFEFNHGNFAEDGTRKKTYSQLRDELYKQGVELP